MVRVPKRLAVVAAVSAAAAVGLPGGPTTVPAFAPTAAVAASTKPGPIDRVVRRLQSAQNRDGGFGSKPGADSDLETSVWATLALAAVGINPTEQPFDGTDAYEYLQDGPNAWRKYKTTSALAAYVLVLRAVGPQADAARVTAVGALLQRATPGGGFPEAAGGGTAELRATALATLAILNDPAASGRVEGPRAIEKAAEWIKGAFSGSGWGATARARARPDTTGLALQALFAVDPQDAKTRELTDLATPWLSQHVNENGGLGASRLDESDPTATALVMQGLVASKQDPKTFGTGLGNKAPKDYLLERQADDGGFGDTLTTAQILPGFTAKGFALEPVALGSPLLNRRVWSDRAKNAAGTGGGGGAEALSGADAGSDGKGDGDSDSGADDGGGSNGTSGGTSSGGSGGASGTPAASTPSTPSAAPPAATPAPAAPPAPTPTTETTPKPADDTVAAAGNGDDDDDPAGGATQQVNGVVVGAQAAAASKAPGIAAGAGDAGDRGAAILGGLIVALVLVGTQVERRRPRRIVS